ncbi:prolyl hydroxylase family protein [Sphingomonas gilva]|nr:2OG-Fe(II) oxygenase [Sphingomonas gilva]
MAARSAMIEFHGHPSSKRAAIGAQVAAHLDRVATRIEAPGVELYYREAFLSQDECAALIALIDADRRPSTLFPEDAQADFRTSESCDLDTWSPLVRTVDARFAELLALPPANAETLQGQRYGPTQKYGAHHDFFSETSAYWKKVSAVGGQRTWTAMAYLNVPEAGGGTNFPRLGIEVQPRVGMVVIWNNMAADGSPNVATLHEGRPVEAGVKYVVTKWFRENAWG